jgi:hypothetical protein
LTNDDLLKTKHDGDNIESLAETHSTVPLYMHADASGCDHADDIRIRCNGGCKRFTGKVRTCPTSGDTGAIDRKFMVGADARGVHEAGG